MVFINRHCFWIFAISIVNFGIKLCIGSGINSDVFRRSSNNDFDILIFTQRWPITDCMTWMNKGDNHICVLPSQKDAWLIHGVWPTKFGSLGPFFCNSSARFDVNLLQPIMDQMRTYWLNIEKGTPEASLWKHEWEKHGTCASILQELKTENKYFGQGLAWLQQYTMNGVLSKAKIEPGTQYNVTDFYNAVKNTLNTNPSIHCVREKQNKGDQYLSEIKICFNKQLELIDCNGIWNEFALEFNNGIITNCDLNRPINYPSTLPKYILNKSDRVSPKPVWRFPWVNLYKLIQILKWFTL